MSDVQDQSIDSFQQTAAKLKNRKFDPPQGLPSNRISLALQGGGAHGAFTWGVLDGLLAEARLQFDGLSGSSAGALNAVLLADGWVKGGREGARTVLSDFWNEVGRQIPSSLHIQRQGEGSDSHVRLSPISKLLTRWAGQFPPAQINPLDLNPLRQMLRKKIDFDNLRRHCPFKLFVAATEASTGKLRVFREYELSLEVLLASTCLPKLHHPVSVDGKAYWDGGYSANPAVFPLFYDCNAEDILLIILNPLIHSTPAKDMESIDARITEFGFNATFLREMQCIQRARGFSKICQADHGGLETSLRALRFHMIDTLGLASLRDSATKILAHGPFLQLLQIQGRQRAESWLKAHSHDLGVRSSIDLSMWAA